MPGIAEIQMIKKAADRLNNKSDEELTEEIKKLRTVIGSDEEKLKKQIESVRPLRELLDEEQKKKFDMIIAALTEK